MAQMIDGGAIAGEIRASVARDVADLPSPPGLATILVGEDPASKVYIANKRRSCREAGIRDLHRHLPRTSVPTSCPP